MAHTIYFLLFYFLKVGSMNRLLILLICIGVIVGLILEMASSRGNSLYGTNGDPETVSIIHYIKKE